MCNARNTATRTPSGMTLLEVLMAVAMIAIAVMGTFSAWVNSQRLQALQREESMVQAAIERYMNNIRAKPFTQVDNPIPANYDYAANNGVYIPPPGTIIPAYTYTDSTTGLSYTVQDDYTSYGYSGGQYAGDLDPDRLLPGQIKLYLGWTGKGAPSDAALRGVKVSKSFFQGGVLYGDRYWAPQANTPEMRIIFINNELPTEARMGETPSSPSDGIDLNADGVISEDPIAPVQSILEFGDVDSRSMFPRLLALPIAASGRAPMANYQNATRLSVYPVMIQVRWWSVAGLPREIGVLTFLTNRAGSTNVPSNVEVR